jgi:hypothetical protein
MSTLAIILIVVAAIVLIAAVLGFLGVRARDRRQESSWDAHVRAADAALADAAATDRGWQREVMEEVARGALAASRPDWGYGALHLVLVDDRPGVEEDRAHFVAVADDGGETRVILSRQGDRWIADIVE